MNASIKLSAEPETIRIDLYGSENPDQIVGHAEVPKEHAKLVKRFRWHLSDGRAIAEINGYDIEMSSLIAHPSLAAEVPIGLYA